MKLFWIACLWLIIPFTSHAYEIAEFKPNVVDEASVLSPEDVTRLNQEIEKVRAQADILAAVYIIPELEAGVTIEEISTKTFEKWQLGKQGKNNGLLMMVAIHDRRNRMEVGYGIEPIVTDAKAGLILRNLVDPAFKEQRYADGIVDGLEEVINIQKGNPKLSYQMEDGSERIRRLGYAKLIYFWLIGMWGIPFVIAISGLILAALKGTESFHKMSAIDLMSQCLGVTGKEWLFLKLFLTVNPGIFILMFQGEKMEFAYAAFIATAVEVFVFFLAAIPSVNFLKRLFSYSVYEEFIKKDKSGKWKSGSGSSGFWTSGSGWSSSSGGSSSSSSSSSGGGSSGGGGASSSW